MINAKSRADLGGGGWSDAPPPPQGFDPCRPKGSPLCIILRNPFFVTDPKNFLKVPLAPIYTNSEGGARAEKKRFFDKNFPSAWKRLFWPVFPKFCLRRTHFGRNRASVVLWESSENQFEKTDLKKRTTKFSKLFWKSAPPPRENPRWAPG